MIRRTLSRLESPLLLVLLCGIALSSVFRSAALFAASSEYTALKKSAESFYEEKSYAQAYALYLQAEAMTLPPEEARWVSFRVGDTLWRSQAGTDSYDSTKYDEGRSRLEAFVAATSEPEKRDQPWAEAQESLGDFWWIGRANNWWQGWQRYTQALDWWAGAKNIELARQRYIQMVWKVVYRAESNGYYRQRYSGTLLPLEILENVLEIAQTDPDRQRAHYLLAMTLVQQGNWEQRLRVPEEFEAALLAGRSAPFYDAALFHYAGFLADTGRAVVSDDGQWHQEVDYPRALELYQRLVREFKPGATPFYNEARAAIENITEPELNVGVSNVFLPDSEIEYNLNWRNLEHLALSLYPVDLTEDVRFQKGETGASEWLQQIDLKSGKQLRTWSKDTQDKGDYRRFSETLRLDERLPIGAYVLEATSGKLTRRELILVTDTTLVLKTSGSRALVYFCDVFDGAPIPDAHIRLWERRTEGKTWRWTNRVLQTNADGLADFTLPQDLGSAELFVSGSSRDRQAFLTGYSGTPLQKEKNWKLYVYTDRPAYRPGEKAQWKLLARLYDGKNYTTPSGTALEYQINDPRGVKVREGTLKLNTFGSAWDSLEVNADMPLGEYQVQFWTESRRYYVGNAVLFRLEEYKLPEFKVSVETPEEDGRKKTFRTGDKIEISIQAEYYFGGPVANASAEVVIYQSPYYRYWEPVRDYPWFYTRPAYGGYRSGQVVRREMLKTDEAGRATLTVDTPRGGYQDLEYRFEARVIDASRREVTGSGSVRVTRQRYYVHLEAEHALYRPGETVEVDIKAVDANDQPVEAEGTVKVTRDTWLQVWRDPRGQEVTGEALQQIRKKYPAFPPSPQDPGERPWQLIRQGYVHEDVTTRTVRTSKDGVAEFSFRAPRDGYYNIAWTSIDPGRGPIKDQTTVWAANETSTDLGYEGGLEIIIDRDTFQAGQTTPVMLSAPESGAYVLFTVEGDDLYERRLVHMEGRVKLLELQVPEDYVPNVFLHALSIHEVQYRSDIEEVVVPPLRHYLEVEVAPDRATYQPGDAGTFVFTTHDWKGNPVDAELAFGLVDESVYYIQQDYAGDPRQFFFGDKRGNQVSTTHAMSWKAYRKILPRVEITAAAGPGPVTTDTLSEAQAEVDDESGEGEMMSLRASSSSVAAPAAPAALARPRAQKAMPSERSPGASTEAFAPAGGALVPEAAVQVRSDFRSTAFWQPDVAVKGGKATVKLEFPDSLTGWTGTARIATRGNEFGWVKATVRTIQPLMARLQAPRFFVVGDDVTVSAILNNNTEEPLRVVPSLNVEGLEIAGEGQVAKKGASGGVAATLKEGGGLVVDPHSEARVDWRVSARQPGQARIKVVARSEKYADAMEKDYPVFAHGIEKFITRAGKVRGDEATIELELPKERAEGTTALEVQVTPSMAVNLLDALPYLIQYPYGCTEQTMSRFLPAVITARTLKDLGLEPQDVLDHLFPDLRKDAGERLSQLDKVVKAGLTRLYDFQHGDGGWGWWKEGESDLFMSAYVVWGLSLAEDAGVDVRSRVIEQGREFLDRKLVEARESPDLQAFMLHALATTLEPSRGEKMSEYQKKAFDNLWEHREQLNAYTRALLTLSAQAFGDLERAGILVRNLENGVKRDERPDTSVLLGKQSSSGEEVIPNAHWGEAGLYWRWSEGGVEATAFGLRALLAVDPKHALVEPVTQWLVGNRRGARWSNTRDTAITVLALNDYLRLSGELDALRQGLEFELLVNGRSVARQTVSAKDALKAPSRFVVPLELLKNGKNTIRIRRTAGTAPLYFSAEARFFSLEEPIAPEGNQIFVRRRYFKRVGRPTLLKGYVYDREPLEDGGQIRSGDRVEVILTVEGKNNYEYLVFEDLKPAGFEAVQLQSGESLFAKELKAPASENGEAVGRSGEPAGYTGRSRWVYQELRDRKVVLFVDKMPEGYWEIRYDLRAEVPGRFHALPVLGHAMYVPEIRANGDEVRLEVVERE